MPPRKPEGDVEPAAPELTERQIERQAARADDPKEGIALSRWEESPGAHGHPAHVLAGAAALAGWKPNTELTKSEINEGVKAFLAHKPE